MIVMPSNNYKHKELFEKYPDRIALLLNPHRTGKAYFQFRYAIDNAAFNKFNEIKYFKMLDFSKSYQKPIFIVCPDVVGCHDRTLALWHYYYPVLKPYDYPIAFVAQNGCTPETVPIEADWIFVGGLDPWKKDNIHKFIGDRPVHVGRVNSLWMLEYCQELGVASVDGTGWMRARDKKYYDFINWFEGNPQRKLFN